MQVTRYFGLHITRTAGTSLADMARKALGPEECLLLSSFTQQERQHETTPLERAPDYLPVFAHGHYVHESLWSLMLADGPVFSFTVLREPRDRLASIVRHMFGMDLSLDKIQANLQAFPNPLCVEILRCVPLAHAVYAGEPLHVKALGVLSLFDRVCPMTELTGLSAEFAGFWMLPPDANVEVLNASAALNETLLEPSTWAGFVDEDVALWQAIQRPGWQFGAQRLAAALRDTYADLEYARHSFALHLSRYLKSELEALDNKAQFLASIERRCETLVQLASFLKRSS